MTSLEGLGVILLILELGLEQLSLQMMMTSNIHAMIVL